MSKEIEFIDSGLSEFEDLIKEYAEKVSDDKALDAVEVGRSSQTAKTSKPN